MLKRTLIQFVCVFTLLALFVQPLWFDGLKVSIQHSGETKFSKIQKFSTSFFDDSEEENEDSDEHDQQVCSIQSFTPVFSEVVFDESSVSIARHNNPPYSLQERPLWLLNRQLIR